MTTSLELQHFAVLSIIYRYLSNAILVHAVTNNPCHLTCYYTIETPWVHKIPRWNRGIQMPFGAYWCFVAYDSFEQVEAGDTLNHTFVIPTWKPGVKFYYVLAGYVGGEESPSASPIITAESMPQNIIENPSFESWCPIILRPLNWYYPWQSPLPEVYFQDFNEKVDGLCSARAESPRFGLYGSISLTQFPDYSMLSELPLTFQMSYRGKKSTWNHLRIWAKGNSEKLVISRPTLDYQWEVLSCKVNMPANLFYLQVQATHNYQPADPFPYKSWWDNTQVYYTP